MMALWHCGVTKWSSRFCSSSTSAESTDNLSYPVSSRFSRFMLLVSPLNGMNVSLGVPSSPRWLGSISSGTWTLRGMESFSKETHPFLDSNNWVVSIHPQSNGNWRAIGDDWRGFLSMGTLPPVHRNKNGCRITSMACIIHIMKMRICSSHFSCCSSSTYFDMHQCKVQVHISGSN